LASGGRRYININNNQMEDGFDVRGCVGEEARPGRNMWGGRLPIVWGGILINKKNRKMGGPLALDGCRLMEGHNNQPKVGIDGGRGIEEEKQLGRNVWGVLSLCLEQRINEEKKLQQKYVVALDGCQQMKITQQPTKSMPA
jgi:hypothetical protein